MLAAPAVAPPRTPARSTSPTRSLSPAFSGFRIDVTARFNGANYDVETSTFKEGMLKAVTMNYVGRNRAWGGFSTQGAQPTAGSLSISVDGKPRTWLAQYGAAGFLQEATIRSGSRRRSRRSATPTARTRSTHCRRRSASASPAMPPATRPCAANDGKRRIDMLFRKIGMEPAAATGIPGAIGDVLVCEIYTKRVAGEFDEAPKEAETERERPIKIWLARFDNTQIRYPGKLEAQTLFATIRGRVLSFRERPLTPAEAEAMRR